MRTDTAGTFASGGVDANHIVGDDAITGSAIGIGYGRCRHFVENIRGAAGIAGFSPAGNQQRVSDVVRLGGWCQANWSDFVCPSNNSNTFS